MTQKSTHSLNASSNTLTILLFALGAFYTIHSLPETPQLDPDSSGYLEMSPTRTLGYPVFLQIFSPSLATLIQALIYLAAVTRIILESRKWRFGGLLAPLLAGLLLFSKSVTESHGYIMTESLFTSLEIAILAEILEILRTAGGPSQFRLGVLAGLSMTIRPASLAYLPLILALNLSFRQSLNLRRRLGHLILAIAGLLIPTGIESFSRDLIHGERKTSLLGKHLYAKAAMMGTQANERDPRDFADPKEAMLEHALDHELADVHSFLARQPNLEDRIALTPLYEACLEHGCVKKLRSGMGEPDAQINERMARVGLRHILRQPEDFLELSLYHYLQLSAYFASYTPIQSQWGQIRLKNNLPLPFGKELGLPYPSFEPFPPKASAKPFSLLLLGTSIALTGLGLFQFIRARELSPWLKAACLAAMTIQSFMILTALLGVAVQRYMTALWPCFSLIVTFGLGWVLSLSTKCLSREPGMPEELPMSLSQHTLTSANSMAFRSFADKPKFPT